MLLFTKQTVLKAAVIRHKNTFSKYCISRVVEMRKWFVSHEYWNIQKTRYICLRSNPPGRFLATRRLFLRKPFLILGGGSYRLARPPLQIRFMGGEGYFLFFYVFLDALIWACANPMLRPGPREPALFKGVSHLVSPSQWKHQSCDNNLVSPTKRRCGEEPVACLLKSL